ILILDEPTVGLDPLQIRETLALIKELGEQHTILLSTHILSEVEAICRRGIIINMGQIGLSKSLAELETQAPLLLAVRGPADQVAATVRTVDGVTRVTAQESPGDGMCSFEVTTRAARDLSEEISKQVVDKGWGLRRMELRRRKLEDAFFDVLR